MLNRLMLPLIAGLLSLAATPALAEPPIWVIRDSDSTIYLFGTVSVLKKDTQWRTPRVDAAMASADEVWLELNDSDDKANMQMLVQSLAMDPANPLPSRLSVAERVRFEAAVARVGIPAGALNSLKPWMAGMVLSSMPLASSGYEPSYGVDQIINSNARRMGKVIRAFETSEYQLRLYDSLPPYIQVEFLMTTVDDVDDAVSNLDSLVTHWAAGNIKGLEDELVVPTRTKYPALYKVLLTDRNIAWAKILADRLKGKGISFVAVTSAHLVGPESLQTQLLARGIDVVRY